MYCKIFKFYIKMIIMKRKLVVQMMFLLLSLSFIIQSCNSNYEDIQLDTFDSEFSVKKWDVFLQEYVDNSKRNLETMD